jgi:hypothetical protein
MSKPLTADVADLALANITALSLLGTTTSADLGGTTQNDFAPANLASIVVVNLTASSAASITGLAAQPVGRMVVLYALAANVGNVTLTNEDVGSAAANRFDLPGAAIAVLTPGSACWLRYDTTTSRWKMLASTSSTTLPSLIVTGAVTFSGAITPASLPAGLANDYNPAGLASAATIRQAVNAGVVAILSGLTAQGAGRRITIQNLGTGILTITSEDTNSTAANRFSLPGGATWELLTDGAITFLYDGTTARWIAENMTQAVPFVQINTVTSPAAITGTVNDYNPTGLAVAGIVRQALSGATILTGIIAQTDGRILILENIDAVLILTVNSEDTGSAASNRFSLPGGTPILLNPGGSLILVYDGTSARWRSIGQVGATVSPSSPQPGVFADGSDGSVVFDGVSTILGFVPASGRYTITRDLNCINCTVNPGVVLTFANSDTEITNVGGANVHRLFCTGILTLNGKISANGHGGAVGGTVNVGAAGSYAGTASASGGQGNANGGSAGGSPTVHVWNTQPGTLGGAINTPGSNAAGNYLGGGGGGGSASSGGGGGGTTIASSNFGTTRDQRALTTGTTLQPQAITFGGSGGGGASGDAVRVGGAGGGPGGLVCVVARTIVGSGSLEARGAVGNSGAVGGNSGGGGGGGGGSVVLYFIVGIGSCTISVAGGVGGAGVGTGAHGGNGSDGRVFLPQ